jgi:aldose 1-epimerase
MFNSLLITNTVSLALNVACVLIDSLITGNFLGDEHRPFKGGVPQRKQSLICLETQRMPDSVHHKGFTDTILRPDEPLETTTEYRFSVQ